MTDVSNTIDEIAHRIWNATSFVDLQLCLPPLRAIFSLKNITYQGLLIAGLPARPLLLLSTCSQQWAKEYETRGVIEWDPIAKAVRQSVVPVDWETVDWSGADAQRYRLMLEQHDIGDQGITLPLYSPLGDMALFSFTGSIVIRRAILTP